MKVKNILLNEKEKFIDLVIKELIKYKISYVQIGNELHFDNYIFRFYDINDRVLGDMMELENISINELNNELNNQLNEIIEYIPNEFKIDKEFIPPRINKKKIKKQNKIINKKINTKKR